MEQRVFSQRRKHFLKQFKDGIAILFSSSRSTRSWDTDFPYRIDSFFYYLTGFSGADSIAVFAPKTKYPYRLFVPLRSKKQELWEGKSFSLEEIKKNFHPDICQEKKDFEEEFKKLSIEEDSIYYLMNERLDYDTEILKLLRLRPKTHRGTNLLRGLFNLSPILGEMRKIKDEEELNILRLNAENSAKAHSIAMAKVKPRMYEYDIAAILGEAFYRGGAQALAYESIVAAGNNANTLHYTQNRSPLKKGDLVLVDAGGERDCYASDITRTYPIDGKFTLAQKQIYSIVLEAQKAVIEKIKPGIAYSSMHETAVSVLVEGLLSLGIIQGKKEEILESKTYRKFYPHGTGHWLGLDVHDRGSYQGKDGKSVVLEPGHVFTVEPGLYFQKEDTSIPEEYRSIGVRIEDDIIVNQTGHEVISAAAPKEIDAIESLVGTQS